MIIPIRTDSPLRSTPWMNWALIATNVLVFMAQMRFPQQTARYMLDPRSLSLVDYFGYAFMHASPMHIIGNLLFLYIFGNNVNDKMGHIGYLGFYLAGGVFAGIGHVLTSGSPILGASGAVAAVTGAYLVLLPRSNISVIYFLWLIGHFEVPSMWFIALYFAKDLLFNFAQMAGENIGGHVAYSAHIAGTLFGFTISMILLVIGLLPRDQFDVLALLSRWNKRRTYQNMVREGYNPFGHTPAHRIEPRRDEPTDPRTEQIMDLRAQISEALAHHRPDQAAIIYLQLKTIDPQHVLSRQAQLDVANQLFSQQKYPEAAEAYEQFLRQYPKYEQIEQIHLFLGLIYARYLLQNERARHYLNEALQKLHNPRDVELARAELARV
jgi:membrane associated rhomboid family serine protease